MKALTIRQPWAWAILHAGKDIENRNWPTRLRGRIAVHAAKGMTVAEYENFWAAYSDIMRASVSPLPFLLAFDDLPRGAIVGTVEIAGCVSDSGSHWFFGDYGFVLRDPIALPEPIECKGALGFWDVPEEIERLMFPIAT